MKRKNSIHAILVVLVLGITVSAEAQSGNGMVSPFRKGSATINLGVGFGTNYKGDFERSNSFGSKAAFEYGLWKAGPGVVSLGAEVGTSFSNHGRNDKYNDFRGSSIIAAVRSAWHYGWNVSRLDTYAGISTGIGFHHRDYNYGNAHFTANDVGPAFGGFVGASYYLSPSVGFNVEAGYDITSIQAGVVFKL